MKCYFFFSKLAFYRDNAFLKSFYTHYIQGFFHHHLNICITTFLRNYANKIHRKKNSILFFFQKKIVKNIPKFTNVFIKKKPCCFIITMC